MGFHLRRLFFGILLCTGVTLSCQLSPTPLPTLVTSPQITPTIQFISSQVYQVGLQISFTNAGQGNASRILLHVAVPHTIDPYQEVLSLSVDPAKYQEKQDYYGNHYLDILLTNLAPGQTREVKIEAQVKVNQLRFDIGDCQGKLPTQLTAAERYIESDKPSIRTLAEQLSQGKDNPCDKAWAIYNWVGDNLAYNGYNAKDIGALVALQDRGGDCTEFTDVFTALSRASSIPAQTVDGVTCCTDNGYNAGDIKHSWAEIYLPGSGWVTVDPTWGRFTNQRQAYFAAMSDDHIWITQGRNPSFLGGYHYYYYQYWWDNQPTHVTSQEVWSILKTAP